MEVHGLANLVTRSKPMRNLLALFGALVLVFVAAGWYLGWYDVRTGAGTSTINVKANKVADDLERGAAAVGEQVKKSREAVVPEKPEDKAQQ
jgi:hypothetical protein